MAKRTTFEMIHDDELIGKLTMADRLIFRGYLGIANETSFRTFLTICGVLLKDFGAFAEKTTKAVKAHAQRVATDAGRPYIYLDSPHTARDDLSKEQLARNIAARDGVTEGLICVLGVVEGCSAFDVRGNRETKKLDVVRRTRKCLHFYFYYPHPEFGFMHVRLQSWFPFTIQVYVNGREWLCRQLDKRGIGYERYDNALLRIDDLAVARSLCRKFFRRRWPSVLDGFARTVNPVLPRLRRRGFGDYYWVTHQAEVATDVMFRDRAALERLLPELFGHMMTVGSAADALRFLGRKPNGNFTGEATSDLKCRPEGHRVKFRMKRNHIKMYDKMSVLRIETTINNPREFRVWRSPVRQPEAGPRWMPMAKGVSNFWHYGQQGEKANARFLESLAAARSSADAIDELDRLTRPRRVRGRVIARFNPVDRDTSTLYLAVLVGSNILNGFRNSDIANNIEPLATTRRDRKRRCERTSRLIAKLRAHGLVCKVPRSRLYRVTPRGQKVLTAAIRYRQVEFARAYGIAA